MRPVISSGKPRVRPSSRPARNASPAPVGSTTSRAGAAGTRVIASVPNIRNLQSLDDLAAGRWEYGPNGVLDITHVRFFTRETLRRLFEETGYTVTQMEPLTQPAALDRLVITRGPGRIVTQNLSISFKTFEDLEDLYALQYVIDARVRGVGDVHDLGVPQGGH